MDQLMKENEKWVDEVFDKIHKKLRKTAESSYDKIPYTTVNGVHDNKAETDISWWTNGFWPGLMWLMYIHTKDEQYRKTAEHAEEMLDKALADYDSLHHDVGFMWNLSSGVNYRLFGNKASKNRLMFAANVLAGRFNPKGGFIRAWNGNTDGWTIIDSMMNIPLLYRASGECNDTRFENVAKIHADTLMRTHIREDGSCNHIVKIDPETGEVLDNFGGQGYETGSSWSRGQSWALYGYVLSYIHTGDEKYLNTAKRAANYFIANVALTDYIPLTDFRAPREPYMIDTTAGACAACGLIEIAKAVPENEGRMYLDAAFRMLHALEKHCDFTDDTESLLQDGMEAYNNGVQLPIIYGDYFFVEALYKLKGHELLSW